MKKLFTINLLLIMLVGLGFNAMASQPPTEWTVTFTVEDADGNPISDAVITFGEDTYPAGQYSFIVPENNYGYFVNRYGYISEAEATLVVDSDKTVDFVLTPTVELEMVENTMNFSWNEQIGTFDAGIIINLQPYNTDGAFVMLKCYNDADELQIFGDIFEEFSIGDLDYHAMTSMRISADFLGEQYSGNWGTHAISDNAASGGSLRGTALNGAIFYGVMVDGTAGTVGIVAPTPTDTDSQDVSYVQKADVSGDFYIVMEAYQPWRPGAVVSTDYYTLAELGALEPLATYTHEFTLEDLVQVAIDDAIANTDVSTDEEYLEISLGEDAIYTTTVEFATFLTELPVDMLVDAAIEFDSPLPAGTIIDITNTTLAINGNITLDGTEDEVVFSDVLAIAQQNINPKSGTTEVYEIEFSNLPTGVDVYTGTIVIGMAEDFDSPDVYLLGENTFDIDVIELIDPIEINTQPVSDIICVDEEITLSIDATVNNGETLTYQWYFNDEIMVDSTDMDIIITVEGEYYCMLTAGADELNSETAIITIDIVAPQLSETLTACSGSTLVLDPGEFDGYEWQDMSILPTLEVTEDGTYSVTVISDEGCEASAETTVTFSDEIEIDLGENVDLCEGITLMLTAPLSDTYAWSNGEDTQTASLTENGWQYVTVTQGTCSAYDSLLIAIVDNPEDFDLGIDTYACNGATVTLEGSTQDGLTFVWSNLETTQDIDVTTTGTYSLVVTNSDGCVNEDEVYVEFNDFMVVNLHSSDTIHTCVGETITLAPMSGIEWLWGDTSVADTLAVTTEAWYYVTVTGNGGCTGDDSVYVHYNLIPDIDLGANQSFCVGITTDLTAPLAETYSWSNEEITQMITVSTSGTYYCTITDVNGCINSDFIGITVYSLPNIDLGEDIEIDDSQTILLGTAPGHTTYEWSTGDDTHFVVIDGSTLTYGDHTYSVTVTSSNSCESSDEVIVTVIQGAGIEENIFESISISPNPNNGIFNIHSEDKINIEVYDNIGKLVLTTNQKYIDISSKPSGMYFVKISNDRFTKTLKVVIQ